MTYGSIPIRAGLKRSCTPLAWTILRLGLVMTNDVKANRPR